ncbi:MAG: hypothetical protein A2W08_15395 [Candidatus Rokubacteria bacterium RBG_16_73_20]|nr:MAG: hypothetical protein A2050_03905 [Candidatus Rokubacteria bacterium GWA2_73_35]OGK91115.1 MAG: hypothetical protein A2W08_15395 [Candidatus Rokubacteria bacterium RBG_16_73_20]HAM56906.1 hypothetical protein [Candidatus Rokubacteria bacterium]HBH02846.1 hypothetical protein [Candidatus Rokubacteria bacterium]
MGRGAAGPEVTTMRRTVGLLLIALVASACASSVALTVPPVDKLRPAGWREPVRVALGSIGGEPCFAEALKGYLALPGGLQLADNREAPHTSLTGRVDRIEVHSNRGDKEVSLLYFSAFVITAPIAAAMYGAKDWHADAAAEGSLSAADAGGRVIWEKTLTVSVSETQRTMPSADALNAAMKTAACQKLAATLLNAFAEHVSAPPPSR